MDEIPDAEYKVVEIKSRRHSTPLRAGDFNNFLSKMARTNEEQQPKANSYLW